MKISQLELFLCFHFKSVAANVSELFYMALLKSKERFIKMNDLKLIQVEIISFFFYFKCVISNFSELFCMAHLSIMDAFDTILTFYFKYKILYACKLDRLS